ncbi:hypothetical protein [Leucobacter sp. OH1287]|uniref:hypothetical protein n=1 Tax=Leucobacter sp. OH1287 TaxID=2491049 RepID=UPI000F5EF25F|nr:hypothetical protein [Leucobacter sp. OH1287]RRD59904.1 hypothetical protein EII30_07735 [Leucobacter sp. OH1287]
MARKNRRAPIRQTSDVSRLSYGGATLEVWRGESWLVRQISAARALKTYVCPGCSQRIAPGVAHIVAWQEDGLFGSAVALEQRRHWHSRCWQIK